MQSDEEPWSLHAAWHIPCYIKNQGIHYLHIDTCAVEPQIVADVSILDFGEVSVGQEVVRTVSRECVERV